MTTTKQSNIAAREREEKDGGGGRCRTMDDNSDNKDEGKL
jgi:hypothetical protein